VAPRCDRLYIELLQLSSTSNQKVKKDISRRGAEAQREEKRVHEKHERHERHEIQKSFFSKKALFVPFVLFVVPFNLFLCVSPCPLCLCGEIFSGGETVTLFFIRSPVYRSIISIDFIVHITYILRLEKNGGAWKSYGQTNTG
jgi:hypothetical protein